MPLKVHVLINNSIYGGKTGYNRKIVGKRENVYTWEECLVGKRRCKEEIVDTIK